MLSLRYLYVLALVMWLGGMAVAGFVVAPATFGVLEAWNPAIGRVLAGQVFGEVLRRLYLVAYGAGAVMFVVLTLQRVLGPRPRSYGLRIGLIMVMLALIGYAGLRISPRIDALQSQVSGPMNQLATDDPRRVEFDGLHRLATALMSAAIVSGLVLVVWEARE
jgi:Domain of unknown function (DUF4149)